MKYDGAGDVIKWSHAGRNVFIKLSPRALNTSESIEEQEQQQQHQDNTLNPCLTQYVNKTVTVDIFFSCIPYLYYISISILLCVYDTL